MWASFGLVLTSSVVTYFAFPNVISNEGFPVLIWGSLVPFFMALDGRSLPQRSLLGSVWGALTFGLLTRWMLPVGILPFLMFVLFLSVVPVFFACAFDPSKKQLIWRVLWWPSIWVLGEWLRAFVSGGFTWSLAYALAPLPEMIRIAAWGGVPIVVWLVVFVNAAVFIFFKSRAAAFQGLLVALVLVVADLCYGNLPSNDDLSTMQTVPVTLVQPNIGRKDKLDLKKFDENVERHLVLTYKALEYSSPELVVWPETAFPDDILKDFRWGAHLQALSQESGVPLLIGSALAQYGFDLNAALMISPATGWSDIYYKKKLVPLSEAAPKARWAQWFVKQVHMDGYNFIPGTKRGVFSLERKAGEAVPFGIMICSEEAYPHLVRSTVKEGAMFLVAMLNDAWFVHPEALMMHAQNAVFRAVETGRSVVRASNSGRTVAFDPRGRVIKGSSLRMMAPGFVTVKVPLAEGRTVYAIFGDIFVGLAALFVIIMVSYEPFIDPVFRKLRCVRSE